MGRVEPLVLGRAATMTIGTLSRRTGVSVKALREYEDAGLIYTVGRSAGNYRLFDKEALWCVGVITGLRSLGLTVAEIRELSGDYLRESDGPIGPRLAELLRRARARTVARISELQQLLARIDRYEANNAAGLAGIAEFPVDDPRAGTAHASAPGRQSRA